MLRRTLKTAIAGLLCGTIIVFLLFIHSTHFKRTSEHYAQQYFAQHYNTTLSGTITRVSLFPPTLYVTNVTDQGDDWHMHAQKMAISIGWVPFKKALSLSCKCDGCSVYTIVSDGKSELVQHITDLCTPVQAPVDIIIKEISLRNCAITIVDPKLTLSINGNLHADMKYINGMNKIRIYPYAGTVRYNNTTVMNEIHGSILYTPQETTAQLTALITGSRCFITGVLQENAITVSAHSHTQDLNIQLTTQPELQLTGTLPLTLLSTFLPIQLTGAAHITAQKKQTGIQIDARLSGIYKAMDIGANTICAHEQDGKWTYNIRHEKDLYSIRMHGQYTQGNIYAYLENERDIPINQMVIQAQRCAYLHGTTADAHMAYNVTCVQPITGLTSMSSGTAHLTQSSIDLSGSIAQDTYHMQYAHGMGSFSYLQSGTTQARVDIHNGHVSGIIDYGLIRSFYQQAPTGKGTIEFTGTCDSVCTGTVRMHNATIRIPGLYNFINEAYIPVRYDPIQQKIVIGSATCTLHQGIISTPGAVIEIGTHTHVPYAYVPILINNCFVSWHKDLFAHISGNLLLTYTNGIPALSGTLLTLKTQLKGNILSPALQAALTHPSETQDIQLNITCATKVPLVVKTSFLQATAQGELVISGRLTQPQITGQIRMVSGIFKFPYKNMPLVHGMITLLPTESMVDLHARTKIKKYVIQIFVNGSLQKPHIRLESIPYLKQEQIVALLLTGVEESSLNILMPTLVIQNMETLIFGPAQQESTIQSFFKSMLTPLSRIRLVPKFADETGRGGLRGALEIDVSDDLHAVIEKNFSLSEDTKIAVDYTLADDMHISGIKDERNDLGAQVEFKWKW